MTQSLVRLITPADVDGVMAAIRLMHAENGLFPLCEAKIRNTINGALNPSIFYLPTVIGVIGSPDNIEATICLVVSQLHYTEERHLADVWNFVRPDCRKTAHNKELLKFAKECSDNLGLKFLAGVVSGERTDAKIELYRKRVGQVVGALFVYEPKLKEAI